MDLNLNKVSTWFQIEKRFDIQKAVQADGRIDIQHDQYIEGRQWHMRRGTLANKRLGLFDRV